MTWRPPGLWLAAAAPPELWRVELDGGQELAPGIVVAAPGRLLGRVQGWNDETAREFGRACAAHARQHTRGLAAEDAADAATAAEKGVAGDSATRVGYMAARAAERRWQSRWLADRLGVPMR